MTFRVIEGGRSKSRNAPRATVRVEELDGCEIDSGTTANGDTAVLVRRAAAAAPAENIGRFLRAAPMMARLLLEAAGRPMIFFTSTNGRASTSFRLCVFCGASNDGKDALRHEPKCRLIEVLAAAGLER